MEIYCKDTPYCANLFLQILLWSNVYEFAIWSASSAAYLLYNLTNIWHIKQALIFVDFIAINIFEFIRLYAGYAGNLKAKTAELSKFLIITPLINSPLLLFLLMATDELHIVILILTYTLFVLMFLEFATGIFTWKNICIYQTEIYKLKQQLILERKLQKIKI